MGKQQQEGARDVIRIIDKIVPRNESIIRVVERAKKLAQHVPEGKREKRTVQFIIMHYSNLTAAGGGLSAVPGLIPFVGTVFSIFGASALDALIALKYELEMTLALAHLAGFDIEDPRERKLAFLLVCASLEEAYEEEKEPSLYAIVDLAMGEFSTREMSKSLVKLVARVMTLMVSKKWTRYFPFVGIAIGASVNKLMSTHTGYECWRALKHRQRANES